jgi:probable lipoprotein NlpC
MTIATRKRPQEPLALLVLLCTLVTQACATGGGLRDFEYELRNDPDLRGVKEGILPVRHRRGVCCMMASASQQQRSLAMAATAFLGRSRVEVDGNRFTYDCSGLARGVYFAHGVDLFDGLRPANQTNGVRLIYRHVKRYGRLHHGPQVYPGDLVFFHNTWDFNGDGRLNDLLTHIGVVERVDHDGTVVFVSRVSGGIERYRMNLRYPDIHRTSDGRVLNDYLRRKHFRDHTETPYLTGELFASFGTLID